MVDEKRFDYDKYIQERLREIDDLDERRPDRLAARYLQKNAGRQRCCWRKAWAG